MAEANLAAASKSEVASLRSRAGNQRPMALALAGKVGASPTPSNKRAPNNPLRFGVTAAANEADAPQKCPDAAHAPHAELVENDADGQLAKRVGPVVSAGKIAEDNVGDAEGDDQ